MRNAFLVAIVATQIAPASLASAAPRTLPERVRMYVAEMDRSCRQVRGSRGYSPGLVRSVDLTNDGVIDHLIDEGRYQCIGSASVFFAGHNGAAMTIFVGQKDGSAVNAYEGYSHGIDIRREGHSWRVHVVTYGLDCGQQRTDPSAPFSDAVFCTRVLDWNPQRNTFAFAPGIAAPPQWQH